MDKNTLENMVKQWKTEVYNKSNQIDPAEEMDWYSLAVGWFMGKGYSSEESHKASLYIRYHTQCFF